MRSILLVALSLAALPAAAQSVKGGSCQELWLARNAIYREAGYCFRTPRAISTFGNAGCRHDSVATLPMTPWQRGRVAEIGAQERALGCAG